MKGIQNIIFALLLAPGIFSCGNRGTQPESKKEAEEKNDEKFATKANETEAQFIVDAISNSMAEVRLTELAEQRAIDPTVKTAAISLNREHNALLETLKEYATQRAISIPNDASDHDKKQVEKLISAKNFDKEWCKEAESVNKETIESYEEASTSLTDPKLKDWLVQVLPNVRKAHDQVMACEAKLK